MFSLRRLKLAISFVMLLAAVPAAAGAAPDVSFRMTIEEKGSEVEVVVLAEDATDLYAFDLLLEIDPDVLLLKKATSGMQGFTVAPLLKGDTLQFAHTKIGGSPASNGDVILAILLFERIGGEASAVRLIQAQLVNSQLDMDHYTPDAAVGIRQSTLWSDAVGHWAEAFIRDAMKRRIVDGYADGTFRPERVMTRAEFSAMLVRTLQLPTEDDPELPFADKTDIPAWARASIAAAVQSGLIVGYEDGTFRANNPIRREEMAAILIRARSGMLGAMDRDMNRDAEYADDNLISEWARPYVAAVSEAGIMNGRSGNRFAPLASLTRAEAVAVLIRLWA